MASKAAIFRTYFRYDEASGDLYWKIARGPKEAGAIAGCKRKSEAIACRKKMEKFHFGEFAATKGNKTCV